MKRINKILDFQEKVPQNVRNALNRIGDKQLLLLDVGAHQFRRLFKEP